MLAYLSIAKCFSFIVFFILFVLIILSCCLINIKIILLKIYVYTVFLRPQTNHFVMRSVFDETALKSHFAPWPLLVFEETAEKFFRLP